MIMWQSVAVFCGSKYGKDPMFAKHAEAVGELLAQNNIQLIYGGGKRGLMGIVADAVLKNNGKAIGVSPGLLNEKEHQHDALTALYVVETMHERKRMMFDLCDAAIILPGGFGTLDELFEMITWNNLNIHNKQIVLINTNGYYDALITHLKKMDTENFLADSWQQAFIIIQDPQILVSLMDADKYQSHRE